MVEPHIIEHLRRLVELNDEPLLKQKLNDFHSADLAEIFDNISEEERLNFFKYLEMENAADLLEELSPQIQVELLGTIDEETSAKIVSKMPHDIMADLLGDLSDEEINAYLNRLPERVSSQIKELMSYREDSAGGIMTTEFLRVYEDMSVEETLSYIRSKATSNIDFYYIYVVDSTDHLLGVLSLRSLISSPLDMKVNQLMITDVFRVNVNDDQDDVADSLIRYGFLAIPVVDNFGKLRGIITWDDAQDIAEEETTEEIYASSGISTEFIEEDEILTGRLVQSVKARAPWLLITLIGEFIAVNVANSFDGTLHQLPIIAIFMPLLAGLGGNIGTQSVTLMVRGLSTGQINMNSAMYHIFREVRIGLIIGFLFGILVMLVTWNWKNNVILGAVVGIAMAANMTIATVLGTASPFLLKRLGADPAVASGPFIATAIDVVGLAVYFTLVTASLKFF